MRALAIFTMTLLLLESFYSVEGSERDRGPKIGKVPYCRHFCSGPQQCGPPCPNCKGSWWTPYLCDN
uniref:Putative 5.3 kDa protein n=1 Tax=Ixodes ricinus TaxID=34613 RepID=A0A0K8RKI1_IXORI